MKHLTLISRRPGKADDAPPVDIQFIIDVLLAIVDKKTSFS
jgi:hypothetical protein